MSLAAFTLKQKFGVSTGICIQFRRAWSILFCFDFRSRGQNEIYVRAEYLITQQTLKYHSFTNLAQ